MPTRPTVKHRLPAPPTPPKVHLPAALRAGAALLRSEAQKIAFEANEYRVLGARSLEPQYLQYLTYKAQAAALEHLATTWKE